MLPTSYEFHWDTGHLAFLGIFYAVITVVLTTLAFAARRWLRDLRLRRAGDIAWHEAISDLPAERRHCRHEFDGSVPERICAHGFACDTCPEHSAPGGTCGLLATATVTTVAAPDRRLYHRGHTWVEPAADGTFTVGVDDLLQRCLGRPDRVTVPEVGTVVQAGGAVAEVQRGRIRARLTAPVTGVVVATGDYSDGALYRVAPVGPGPRLDRLLGGNEARVWMLREYEALQAKLLPAGMAPALADGGELVADLIGAYPDADWDAICADFSLTP